MVSASALVGDAPAPVRIDKWLWAARLAKTRALAAEAVRGGRVHVNGQSAKPSKTVGPGDRVQAWVGHDRMTVIVRGVAERRGPASEAVLLYEETPESRESREQHAELRRLAAPTSTDWGGRPTKRDRRRFDKTSRKRG